MLNVAQFRELIIKPALSKLQLYSNEAEELLVFTCATESDGGTYLKQKKGIAFGIYQIEPATYNDLWQNYIMKRSDLTLKLAGHFNAYRMPIEDRLIYDLDFATAMARIYYRRIPEPLPKKDDVDAIWDYYKKYFNTELGKATKAKSIKKYQSFLSQ